MRSKNFNKRVAALEASVRMQPGFGVNVVEQAKLPDREKEVLLQALQNRVVVISHEELDRLNAAIDTLPAAERARMNQALEEAIIVAMSEADLGV